MPTFNLYLGVRVSEARKYKYMRSACPPTRKRLSRQARRSGHRQIAHLDHELAAENAERSIEVACRGAVTRIEHPVYDWLFGPETLGETLLGQAAFAECKHKGRFR